MADQWPVDSDIILEEVINGMRKAKKPKILILNILQEVLFLKKIRYDKTLTITLWDSLLTLIVNGNMYLCGR